MSAQKTKDKEIIITLFVGELSNATEKYLIKDEMKKILGRKFRRCMF